MRGGFAEFVAHGDRGSHLLHTGEASTNTDDANGGEIEGGRASTSARGVTARGKACCGTQWRL